LWNPLLRQATKARQDASFAAAMDLGAAGCSSGDKSSFSAKHTLSAMVPARADVADIAGIAAEMTAAEAAPQQGGSKVLKSQRLPKPVAVEKKDEASG